MRGRRIAASSGQGQSSGRSPFLEPASHGLRKNPEDRKEGMGWRPSSFKMFFPGKLMGRSSPFIFPLRPERRVFGPLHNGLCLRDGEVQAHRENRSDSGEPVPGHSPFGHAGSLGPALQVLAPLRPPEHPIADHLGVFPASPITNSLKALKYI